MRILTSIIINITLTHQLHSDLFGEALLVMEQVNARYLATRERELDLTLIMVIYV